MTKFLIKLMLLLSVSSVSMANNIKPPVSDDFSIYGGHLTMDDHYRNDFSFNKGEVIGGVARVNVWLNSEWSTQFDISGEHIKDGPLNSNTTTDYSYSVLNTAAHISYRKSNYLVGGFFSISEDHAWWDDKFRTFGLEGQYTIDRVVLYGQFGRTKSIHNSGDYYDTKAIYGRAEGKYFITDNLMLSANVGLTEYSSDFGDIDGRTWGLDTEYRFDKSPVSFFASYQGSYEEEKAQDIDWTTASFIVGIRYSLGTKSLRGASQFGPTLHYYNPFTGVSHVRFSHW